ncbi:hypothetical protein [Pukyongiella litopenaei]|uniref:Uncharacterized protein n=1 Tax=Pukyongiella litopenaei TaxID=2605946 RepID=A0A2S0MSC5_9RHOB|nr:hypothetical protein [Pukyongiella litopenaei]AVO38795.2 hypothetical protein C6Y53_14555 [Pukyongiella litopenaei]
MYRFFRGHVLGLAILTTILAAPGFADTLGTLSFEFEGAKSEWITRSREVRGKLRHSATLTKGSLLDTIDVTAYPEEAAIRERFAISMVFSRLLTENGSSEYGRPTGTTIIRLLGGITGPRWEARDISVSFDLTETSEAEAMLVGSFEGVFCYLEKVYATAQEDSCRPGSGAFHTRLVIENDE